MNAATGSDAKWRQQRDRFVSLAFASADTLIEIDGMGTIRWCGGASAQMFGCDEQDMIGRSLVDISAGAFRKKLATALTELRAGERLRRLPLAFNREDGETVSLELSGLPAASGRFAIALTFPGGRDPIEAAADALIQLPEPSAEAAIFAAKVAQAAQGGDLVMSLLRLHGAEGRTLAMVEGVLAALAKEETLQRLDDSHIGLLHQAGLQPKGMVDGVVKAAGLPECTTNSLKLDEDIKPEDIAKAVALAADSFRAGKEVSGASLSRYYDDHIAKLRDAASKRSRQSDALVSVKPVLGVESLRFAYQPVLSLYSWSVHHYEALARLVDGYRVLTPPEFLGIAKEGTVIQELDASVIRAAIEALKQNIGLPQGAKISINLSSLSLGTAAFVDDLLAQLYQNTALLPRLQIEITDTRDTVNLEALAQVVNELRGIGCTICLDDFAIGPSAFRFLRHMDVDFVKIDGSYILDAFDARHGKAFLRAISSACSEMGIKMIGTAVEQEKAVHMLREIGIGYGQGMYFAKPEMDVKVLKIPSPPMGVIPRKVG